MKSSNYNKLVTILYETFENYNKLVTILYETFEL